MTIRYELWYIFALFAVGLILLRLYQTRRANLGDPIVLSFALGLFLGSFGTLSKQPFLARAIDGALGPNSAWLIADVLFVCGLCAGTYWVDLMRLPDLRNQGRRLIRRWRVITLITIISWMTIATHLEATTWAILERGGVDTGGRSMLLAARLAYFVYSIWALTYLSYHFYRQRQHMHDRLNYIRLTIPWLGISLAITAPVLQAVAVLEVFVRPEWLSYLWPPLWMLISVIQIAVAILILTTFFPPAYKFVSWADKQLLVHRLQHIRQIVVQRRPELELEPTLDRGRLIVRDPDHRLTTLVNELETVKQLTGKATYEIKAPAGAVMPDAARYALRQEQRQFLQDIKKSSNRPHVIGETYALARWYSRL